MPVLNPFLSWFTDRTNTVARCFFEVTQGSGSQPLRLHPFALLFNVFVAALFFVGCSLLAFDTFVLLSLRAFLDYILVTALFPKRRCGYMLEQHSTLDLRGFVCELWNIPSDRPCDFARNLEKYNSRELRNTLFGLTQR